jgi:tetratricopeptide (TPR) repeat protein
MPDPAYARCPRCGGPQSAASPAGLCPRCVMGEVLEADGDTSSGFTADGSGRVLDALTATCGPMPRVLLRDADSRDDPGPMVRPSSDEMPLPDDRPVRVQLLGEIARGGMGAVLKGRDPDLGRDLAVKVLLESHEGRPELVRRFVEEAQISGQLQHPGIVPVYELGAFADHRPYFTMKLVKGRTLATLLAERPSPAADRPRFLAIFEAVCQTVAYAHARGVIHRDLKPSNVMVGSFGEVQVMDWGLAKVLKHGGIVDEPSPEPSAAVSVIATVRSGSSVDESESGSVLGTPAYMAPEQASGERDRLDQRVDVFGLGSILCEILTGQPAYMAGSQPEVMRKAMRGDTADALRRLDGCGADAELVALAKDCLAAERDDRPRDAGIVAGRVTAYEAGVQARVQAAERERAVALARAVEERRRRKLQLGLVAAVVAFTTLGGLSTTYYFQQRQARAAAIDRIVGQAATLRAQAMAHADDVARWQVALAAVDQADAGGDAQAESRLVSLRREIQAGLDAARRDRELLDRLVDIRSAEADDSDGSTTDTGYADAFREAAIDVSALPAADATAKIRARPPSVAMALAAALDEWARIRRVRRTDAAGAAALSAVARAADPNPWRNELRAALNQPKKADRRTALQALAKSAKFEELGPVSLHLLGCGLNDAGDGARAESVLRAAQERHPGDVWVNYMLATVLETLSRRDEAIRFYTAARAIRPETAHELAHALEAHGQSDEAVAVFRDLRRLRPGNARHLTCLAHALEKKGLSREAHEAMEAAVAVGREQIRLKPEDALAHFNLGNALSAQGKPEEAVAELRTAIRLKPDDAAAHHNLGGALSKQGKRVDSIAEYRTAIRLKPDSAVFHYSLGRALDAQGEPEEAIAEIREAIRLEPDYAEAHNHLGAALAAQGKREEAIAEYRTAIQLKPDYAEAHDHLGVALAAQGKREEAIAEYRTAIRHEPDRAKTHSELGQTLILQGKPEDGLAELRTAIRLQPDLVTAHFNLGNILLMQRNWDEAIAEFRTVIRLDPDNAEPHCNLGQLLRMRGDFSGSLESYRKGHELGSRRPNWRYPSAAWVAEAERMLALSPRFPAILRGEDPLRDNADRQAIAEMCYATERYAAAARFWARAFEVEPKLAETGNSASRYSAACAAALAGCGQGQDNPKPDEGARGQLRSQALGWLKAELTAWSESLGRGGPGASEAVAQSLLYWRVETDFAGVRDSDALAKLPEAERAAWRALWDEVDAMLQRAAQARH